MVGVIEFRLEATREHHSPDKFLETHVTCNVTSIVTCDVTRQQLVKIFTKKIMSYFIPFKVFVGLNLNFFQFFRQSFGILVVNYIYCFLIKVVEFWCYKNFRIFHSCFFPILWIFDILICLHNKFKCSLSTFVLYTFKQ